MTGLLSTRQLWQRRKSARGETKPALVMPVGDAMMEPFWPQGLGSNRGFHTALNAVWAALCARERGLPSAVQELQFAFFVLVQSHAVFRPEDHAKWTADYADRLAGVISIGKNLAPAKFGEGAVPARLLKR